MRKAMTLALAGLTGLSAGAHATLAKDEGFGAASAFMVDDSSYTTLPQEVDAYKGAAYFEFGVAPSLSGTAIAGIGPGNQLSPWGGANIPFGEGALGVWAGRADDDFAGLYAASQITAASLPAGFVAGMDRLSGMGSLGPADTVDALYNADPARGRIDLIYAFEYTDRINVALGMNRANSDQKIDFGGATGDDAYDANNLGLTLGADFKNLYFMKLLQAGLQLNEESLLADANSAGTDNRFSSSATDMNLRLGADTAGDNGSFGRIELGLKTGVLAVEAEPGSGTSVTDNGSGTDYNLGYALGTTQDKGMGLCGLMVQGSYGGDDNTGAGGDRTSYYNVNLVLSTAGELKLEEWLTARAGLSGSLFSTGAFYTGAAVGAATPVYSASNSGLAVDGMAVAPAGGAQASLGLSLNLGGITVDGGLNQNLLYAGTYRVSGLPGALLSMTWNWE